MGRCSWCGAPKPINMGPEACRYCGAFSGITLGPPQPPHRVGSPLEQVPLIPNWDLLSDEWR